jgi:hypothetical protein
MLRSRPNEKVKGQGRSKAAFFTSWRYFQPADQNLSISCFYELAIREDKPMETGKDATWYVVHKNAYYLQVEKLDRSNRIVWRI